MPDTEKTIGEHSASLGHIEEQLRELRSEVKELRSRMDRGWGVILGVVGFLGFMSGELVNAVKRALNIGG